jgi:hypothetical protein
VRLRPADLDAPVDTGRVEAVTSSSRSQQIPNIPRFRRASQPSTRSNKTHADLGVHDEPQVSESLAAACKPIGANHVLTGLLAVPAEAKGRKVICCISLSLEAPDGDPNR